MTDVSYNSICKDYQHSYLQIEYRKQNNSSSSIIIHSNKISQTWLQSNQNILFYFFFLKSGRYVAMEITWELLIKDSKGRFNTDLKAVTMHCPDEIC